MLLASCVSYIGLHREGTAHGVDYERGVVVWGPVAVGGVVFFCRGGRAWRSGLGSCSPAADGLGTNDIVDPVGVSRPTGDRVAEAVRRTRAPTGLDDTRKPGRPRPRQEAGGAAGEAALWAGAAGGDGHWSIRLLADHLKISNYTVSKVWRRSGLQPRRRETFKFSTNPKLEAKIRDVVGLYLNPREGRRTKRRRKIPDSSPGPDPRRSCRYAPPCRSKVTPTTTCGTAPPSLFAALESRHRPADRAVQATDTATTSSSPSRTSDFKSATHACRECAIMFDQLEARATALKPVRQRLLVAALNVVVWIASILLSRTVPDGRASCHWQTQERCVDADVLARAGECRPAPVAAGRADSAGVRRACIRRGTAVIDGNRHLRRLISLARWASRMCGTGSWLVADRGRGADSVAAPGSARCGSPVHLERATGRSPPAGSRPKNKRLWCGGPRTGGPLPYPTTTPGHQRTREQVSHQRGDHPREFDEVAQSVLTVLLDAKVSDWSGPRLEAI